MKRQDPEPTDALSVEDDLRRTLDEKILLLRIGLPVLMKMI